MAICALRGRTSVVGPSAVAIVLLFVLVDASRADAVAPVATCDASIDTAEVTHPLRYVGPHQRVFREGKMNFRCFNAQHWEDLYMFQQYFGNVTQGFFVELGALDGWSYSVSYFFEQFLDWRGLLIEASPKNFLQYKAKMHRLPARRRRKSEYLLSAVCNDPKPLTYVSKEGTGAGILEFMPQDQQARNRKMCTEGTLPPDGAGSADMLRIAQAEGAGSCSLVKIQCIHLGDLLRQRNVKKIDMFVLDVEGAELEVLSTLRLNEIPVHFFLIELDGKAPTKDAAVRCILRRHNYVPIGRLDLNEVWRRRDFDASRYAYGSPVPASRWSGCFKGPVDEPSFFAGKQNPHGPEVAATPAPASGGDGEPQLDADFQQFDEVEGRPPVQGEDTAGGIRPDARRDFVYGYQQPPQSDFLTDTNIAWLLIIAVPVAIVAMRRRGRGGAGLAPPKSTMTGFGSA